MRGLVVAHVVRGRVEDVEQARHHVHAIDHVLLVLLGALRAARGERVDRLLRVLRGHVRAVEADGEVGLLVAEHRQLVGQHGVTAELDRLVDRGDRIGPPAGERVRLEAELGVDLVLLALLLRVQDREQRRRDLDERHVGAAREQVDVALDGVAPGVVAPALGRGEDRLPRAGLVARAPLRPRGDVRELGLLVGQRLVLDDGERLGVLALLEQRVRPPRAVVPHLLVLRLQVDQPRPRPLGARVVLEQELVAAEQAERDLVDLVARERRRVAQRLARLGPQRLLVRLVVLGLLVEQRREDRGVRLLLHRILGRGEHAALLVDRGLLLRVDQRHAGATERLGLEHHALDLDRRDLDRDVARGRGLVGARAAATAGCGRGRLAAATRDERTEGEHQGRQALHGLVCTTDPRDVATQHA